jgi:dCMP deaminase
VRPSRPLHLMRHALLASERSTCARLNVGAVIVCRQTKNIVATGYNGPPSGEEHCTGNICPGITTGCARSVHAEMNALQRMVLDDRLEYDMYVTHTPCLQCTHQIIHRRQFLRRLFYGVEFRDTGHMGMLASNLEVYKITPGGYITNRSGELVDAETLYP